MTDAGPAPSATRLEVGDRVRSDTLGGTVEHVDGSLVYVRWDIPASVEEWS